MSRTRNLKPYGPSPAESKAKPEKIEILAFAASLITIPAYAFAAGCVQYLGYPVIRALKPTDLLSLALIGFPTLVVVIAPASLLCLWWSNRGGPELTAIGKASAIFVLSSTVFLGMGFAAILDLDAGSAWSWEISFWKILCVIAASACVTFAVWVFGPRILSGSADLTTTVLFIVVLSVGFYGAGYAKSMADYWRAPRWEIIAPASNTEAQPALLFFRREGLCVFRLETHTEPTIVSECTLVRQIGRGRACMAATPTVGRSGADVGTNCTLGAPVRPN